MKTKGDEGDGYSVFPANSHIHILLFFLLKVQLNKFTGKGQYPSPSSPFPNNVQGVKP